MIFSLAKSDEAYYINLTTNYENLYHSQNIVLDMQVSTLAEKILKSSKSIRYVTIASLNGKLLFSAHRKTVKTTLSKSESKQSLIMAARAWKLRRSLAQKIGRCKYVVAEYDRVKRITLPAGKNHIIYITTDPKANHSGIISRVRKFR